MKKIFLLLIMVMFYAYTYSYPYTYDVDFYRLKLENNKMIEKIEKVDYLEKRIVITGVEIKGVRIHKIETNFERRTSEAVIMKDDMINAFKRKNKDIKTIDCFFKDDIIRTKGSIILLGVLMNIEMEGRFYINDKQELIYEIKKAVVNGMVSVPDNIIAPIRERINPVFKLQKLEVPMYMTKVVSGEDRLILR